VHRWSLLFSRSQLLGQRFHIVIEFALHQQGARVNDDIARAFAELEGQLSLGFS